ncbi:DUF6193 family natural product biosynthesis protein [Actinacidiphila guanduensis]|uniref:Uncharacterized protein n=1 Tax=Actinacidiphila guanduensis TaxID=310781 RepID=A0A1H0BMF3_9ACTN|nr:DUF6193 family natural product biosynthesis protein [Actinacidiphila guanduensis]SDN46643.1 hypothetical protein SAMN05216259_104232 [Actinacidiphila guanduensis]
MPEAPDIETAWLQLLEGTPGTRQGDPLVVEAAYAQSRLRALFPFPTHGTLHFLCAAPPPWPGSDRDRLPFIVCGEQPYKIYTPDYGELLGEAATPEEAAALLVAHLPDAVGEDADE